uniref:Uncharacterized protein n=1 Tax=Anguilla anguilla TaxID=7936 RepID=A0A0E9X6U3_ANGAN
MYCYISLMLILFVRFLFFFCTWVKTVIGIIPHFQLHPFKLPTDIIITTVQSGSRSLLHSEWQRPSHTTVYQYHHTACQSVRSTSCVLSLRATFLKNVSLKFPVSYVQGVGPVYCFQHIRGSGLDL